MHGVKEIWALLERTTCLKNNVSKQKDWSFTPAMQDAPAAFIGTAPTVLGIGLPALHRDETEKERGKTLSA
eukprot:5201398-Alexandrium_andersonii.AAC.1